MIVSDLDIEWIRVVVGPLEAHPPLLVYANAELSPPLAAERFEVVAWQPHQIGLGYRRLKNVEAPLRLVFERLKLSKPLAGSETFRSAVPVLGRARMRFAVDHR